MSVELSFRIQGDSEGYVTFECPFCGGEFKLKAEEFQCDEEPFEELFCPYCGLTREKNSFFSSEVIEKAKELAFNYMAEKMNKSVENMVRSINSSHCLIKMGYKPLKKVETSELKDKDTVETEFSCACCERHVKVLYCAGASKVFCPYCGVDI